MKKKNEVEEEKEQKIDPTEQILALATKEYGKVFARADELVQVKPIIVPTTPKLDLAIGGGIPLGSWASYIGPPKCGKTSLALHTASNYQAIDPSYHVYYLDIEGRLKTMNLSGIANLDMTRFHSFYSTKQHLLTGQEFLEIGKKVLTLHPNSMLIVDSWSALCHSNETSDDSTVGMSTRGAGGYNLIASFTRQLAQTVLVNKNIVIGIIHHMSNVSGYGSDILEKSGNAIKYQVDVKLNTFGKPESWVIGGTKNPEGKVVGGKRVGQKTKWRVECSALGPPGLEAETCLRYGKGMDATYEIMMLGIDFGLIEQNSSWFTYKDIRAQGQEKLYQALLEKPDDVAELHTKIKEMHGLNA